MNRSKAGKSRFTSIRTGTRSAAETIRFCCALRRASCTSFRDRLEMRRNHANWPCVSAANPSATFRQIESMASSVCSRNRTLRKYLGRSVSLTVSQRSSLANRQTTSSLKCLAPAMRRYRSTRDATLGSTTCDRSTQFLQPGTWIDAPRNAHRSGDESRCSQKRHVVGLSRALWLNRQPNRTTHDPAQRISTEEAQQDGHRTTHQAGDWRAAGQPRIARPARTRRSSSCTDRRSSAILAQHVGTDHRRTPHRPPTERQHDHRQNAARTTDRTPAPTTDRTSARPATDVRTDPRQNASTTPDRTSAPTPDRTPARPQTERQHRPATERGTDPRQNVSTDQRQNAAPTPDRTRHRPPTERQHRPATERGTDPRQNAAPTPDRTPAPTSDRRPHRPPTERQHDQRQTSAPTPDRTSARPATDVRTDPR